MMSVLETKKQIRLQNNRRENPQEVWEKRKSSYRVGGMVVGDK